MILHEFLHISQQILQTARNQPGRNPTIFGGTQTFKIHLKSSSLKQGRFFDISRKRVTKIPWDSGCVLAEPTVQRQTSRSQHYSVKRAPTALQRQTGRSQRHSTTALQHYSTTALQHGTLSTGPGPWWEAGAC